MQYLIDDHKEALKQVIDTMEEIIKSDNETQQNQHMMQLAETLKSSGYNLENPESYSLLIVSQIINILTQTAEYLHEPVEETIDDDYRPNWIYLNYHYLETHIQTMIYNKTKTYENITDKSQHIIRMYLNHAVTGNIPKDDFTTKRGHIPEFGTNLDWIEFCDGLYFLYSGDSHMYLEMSLKLMNADIHA